MKLYIDYSTGTWGDAEHLVVFDADCAGSYMDKGGDAYTVLAFLENASDSEINDLGYSLAP